eukprot:195770_1
MADGNDTEMAGMKQKQQGHGRSFSVEDIKGPSKTIMILVYVLLAYSVIISTVALIMVIMAEGNSGGSSESCDCTVNSLAAKTELTSNGVGDSGFCPIVAYCMDTTDTTQSNEPSLSPSNRPTKTPSSNPIVSPSKNPSTLPSNYPTNTPVASPTFAPVYYDGYFIGDFKMSLQTGDHAFWKLCDGRLFENDGVYSALFAAIGYKF